MQAPNDADHADDDSDNGSTESTTSVLLGFADGAIKQKDEGDLFTNKIGGIPSFAVDLPALDVAKCDVCKDIMPLLLQISAPLTEEESEAKYEGKDTFDRLLYVWACMRNLCQAKEGSVKVYRALLPIFKADQPPREVTDPVNPFSQQSSSKDDGFGSNLFSSEASFANPFTTDSDLPVTSKDKILNRKVLRWSDTPPILPAQYINSEYELRSSDDPEAVSTLASQLQQSNLLVEGSGGASKPIKMQGNRRQKAKNDSSEAGSPADGNWAGEGYENQSIEGIDDAFLHFQERVLIWAGGENADQVLRYHRGGKPLPFTSKDEAYRRCFGVPTKSVDGKIGAYLPDRLPKCRHCGEDNIFEIQIMPQIIAVLSKTGPLTDSEANEFTWSTIWCFFCSADCQLSKQSNGSIWAEGLAIIQQELA